ncbi:wd g-beta repeat-containing protein [Cystoisospora suis]|uniref:Wd g-beta repeat-containing protein n=1 Tax=Cystoisospora suis TaxID=483139 RepID=A0A2C6LIE6_9APIC|nr:wd g-beta repeat-containing protein [Cystoisospora suis]
MCSAGMTGGRRTQRTTSSSSPSPYFASSTEQSVPPRYSAVEKSHAATMETPVKADGKHENTVTGLSSAPQEASPFDILLTEDVLRLLLLFCSAREAVALSGVSRACRTALMTAVSLEPLWHTWWLERRFQYWPFAQYPPLYFPRFSPQEPSAISISSRAGAHCGSESSNGRGDEQSLVTKADNVGHDSSRLTSGISSSSLVGGQASVALLSVSTDPRRYQYDSRIESTSVRGRGGGEEGNRHVTSSSTSSFSHPLESVHGHHVGSGCPSLPRSPEAQQCQPSDCSRRPVFSATVCDEDECCSAGTTAFSSTTTSTAVVSANHDEASSHTSSPRPSQSSLPPPCPLILSPGTSSELYPLRGLNAALQDKPSDSLEESTVAVTQKTKAQQKVRSAGQQEEDYLRFAFASNSSPHILALPEGVQNSYDRKHGGGTSESGRHSSFTPPWNWRSQLLWSERTLYNWTTGACTRSRIQSPDHSFLSVAVYPSYENSNCVCRTALSASSVWPIVRQWHHAGPSKASSLLGSRQQVAEQGVARPASENENSTAHSSISPTGNCRCAFSEEGERGPCTEEDSTSTFYSASAAPCVAGDLGEGGEVIARRRTGTGRRVRQGECIQVDHEQIPGNIDAVIPSTNPRDSNSRKTVSPSSSPLPRLLVTSQDGHRRHAAGQQEATHQVSSTGSSSSSFQVTRGFGPRITDCIGGLDETQKSDCRSRSTSTFAQPALLEGGEDFYLHFESPGEGGEFDRILHIQPCLFTVSSDRVAIHQYMPVLDRRRATPSQEAQASSSSRTKKKNLGVRSERGRRSGGGSNQSTLNSDKRSRASYPLKGGLTGRVIRDGGDDDAFLPKVLSSPSLPPVSAWGTASSLSAASCGGGTTTGGGGGAGGRHNSNSIERLQSDLDLYELYLWQQTGATPNNVKGIPTTHLLDSNQFESIHPSRGGGGHVVGRSNTETAVTRSPMRQPEKKSSCGVGGKGARHLTSNSKDANKGRNSRKNTAPHYTGNQKTNYRHSSAENLLLAQVPTPKTPAQVGQDAVVWLPGNRNQDVETRKLQRSATVHSSSSKIPPPFSLEPSYHTAFGMPSSPRRCRSTTSARTPDLQVHSRKGRRRDDGEDDGDDDAFLSCTSSADSCRPLGRWPEDNRERTKESGNLLPPTTATPASTCFIKRIPSGSQSSGSSSGNNMSSSPFLYARRPVGDGDDDGGKDVEDVSLCSSHHSPRSRTIVRETQGSDHNTLERLSDEDGASSFQSGPKVQTPHLLASSRSLSSDTIFTRQQHQSVLSRNHEPPPPPSVYVISRFHAVDNQTTELLSCRIHPPTARMACCLLSRDTAYDRVSFDSKFHGSGGGGTGRRRKKSTGGRTTPRITPRGMLPTSPGRLSSSSTAIMSPAPCQGRLYNLRGGQLAWNLAVDGALWYPLRLHFVFSDDGSLLFAYDRWTRDFVCWNLVDAPQAVPEGKEDFLDAAAVVAAHSDGILSMDVLGGLSTGQSSCRILAGSRDDTISLYTAEPFVRLQTFSGHQGEVSAVCWVGGGGGALPSPSNDRPQQCFCARRQNSSTFASGAYDALVKIWDTRQHNTGTFHPDCQLTLLEHHSRISSIAAAGPEQRMLVTGDTEGVVKLWDLRRCTKSVCTVQYDGPVSEIQATPAFCLVCVSSRRGKDGLHVLDFSADYPL